MVHIYCGHFVAKVMYKLFSNYAPCVALDNYILARMTLFELLISSKCFKSIEIFNTNTIDRVQILANIHNALHSFDILCAKEEDLHAFPVAEVIKIKLLK